jgi:hypothetical protein
MAFTSGPYAVSMGGSALLAGARTTTTVNVPGAAVGMQVMITPQGDVGAGVIYGAFVSSPNTVTAWAGAIVALTPSSMNYNIYVIS